MSRHRTSRKPIPLSGVQCTSIAVLTQGALTPSAVVHSCPSRTVYMDDTVSTAREQVFCLDEKCSSVPLSSQISTPVTSSYATGDPDVQRDRRASSASLRLYLRPSVARPRKRRKPDPARCGVGFSPDVWRCRDSNRGPPTDPPRRLRAYPAVLFSSSAHRPAGGPSRTSRGSLARAVTAPNAGQPEFIDIRRPASGRADRKMGGKEPVRASTYAARAKLSFAGNVSWRFNECSKHLGTQPRIHRTRRNLSSPDPCFQSTP